MTIKNKVDRLEQKIEELERRLCCKTQFFDTVDDLPAEGNTGVIYVTDDGNIYVWNGVDYILNGLGDAYYTNSYVDRLKLLGSDIQYSTTFGGQNASFTINDGLIHLTSIYIPKTSIINGVSWYQVIQGAYTADNYNGIGIYSFDVNTKNLTLVGSTENDGDIWKTANTTVSSKNFITQLTLENDVYYIAGLYNSSAQTTAPTYASNGTNIVSTTISGLNLKLPSNVYLNASVIATNNTLPTTILSTDIVSSSVSYIYWLY